MISSLSPHHWNTKRQTLNLLESPASQIFNTRFAAFMRGEGFVLVTKLHSKICVITFPHKMCDVRLSVWQSHFATDIAELIRVILALSIHRETQQCRCKKKTMQDLLKHTECNDFILRYWIYYVINWIIQSFSPWYWIYYIII